MPIDGPGILDSDLAHDVYHSTLDLYDAGGTPAQLYTHLAELERSCVDELDLEIHLAATAKVLWDIGLPVDELRTRLAQLLDSGNCLAMWMATGDPPLAAARVAALKRLLRQIQQVRKTPRARKKYAKVQNKLFDVGDCVRLEAETATYLGVVCRIVEHRGHCDYAILVMHPDTQPSAAGFAQGRFYGHKIESALHPQGFILGPHVIRPEHRMLLREGNPLQKVAHLQLDTSRYDLGSFGGVLTMQHVIEDFARTIANNPAFGKSLIPLRALLLESPSTVAMVSS